jgi:hypothetical protein
MVDFSRCVLNYINVINLFCFTRAIVHASISYYIDSKPFSSELLIVNTCANQTRVNTRPLNFKGMIIKIYTVF